jgi:hypothetical protein
VVQELLMRRRLVLKNEPVGGQFDEVEELGTWANVISTERLILLGLGMYFC